MVHRQADPEERKGEEKVSIATPLVHAVPEPLRGLSSRWKTREGLTSLVQALNEITICTSADEDVERSASRARSGGGGGGVRGGGGGGGGGIEVGRRLSEESDRGPDVPIDSYGDGQDNGFAGSGQGEQGEEQTNGEHDGWEWSWWWS